MTRQSEARARLEASLRDAGLDCLIETLRRDASGYTIRLTKDDRKFERSDIDESVFEDKWSAARRRLAESARRALAGDQ
jgi:hypothetical protein